MALTWQESECYEGGQAAYLAGFMVEVRPPDEDDPQWFWRVDATSEVSEWPEVWNCGFAASLDEAKKAAEVSVRRAAASREGREPLKWD